MLEYIVAFYASIVATFLTILKLILVKFFVYLIICVIFVMIFFSQIAWEVAKEFIELSNISQYMSTMYSYLPSDSLSLLSVTGVIDFISFIFTAYVAKFVSSYIPFSRF